jgi:predicted small lipoprotein YifL
MDIDKKILVTGTSLVACVASALSAVLFVSGCGQKGPLTMPNDPDFKQRATLPDIVRRQLPSITATPAVVPASSAASTPATTAHHITAPTASSPASAASAAGR